MHDTTNRRNGNSDAIPSGLLDAFPREEIAISTVPREETNSVIYEEMTIEEFIGHVTTHRIARRKNGSAWSPFTFARDKRWGENAEHTDVIVLDIDNGASLRRILSTIDLAGYAAMVVSSFSHMTTTTTKPFRKVDWDKWRATNPDAPEEEFARSHDKKFIEAVWKDSFVEKGDDGEPVVNGDGYIIVHHGACPKFRIIIPLRERLYLRDLGSKSERAALWAALCDMLAGELRLLSDQDAKLLTQLFFDPRRPAELPEGGEPVVEFLAGKPFDAEAALAKAREAGEGRHRENALQRAPLARQSAVLEPIFTDPRYDRVQVFRSALKAIGNKDIGRTQWVKIGAGTYVEFSGSADGEELFDWWTGLRYEGGVDPEKDTASWVRFRADRPGGSSGKTIRKLAYAAGWTPEEAGFPDYQWGDGWSDRPNIEFQDERLGTALSIVGSTSRAADEGDIVRPNSVDNLAFTGDGSDIYNGGAFAKLYRDRLLFIHETGDVLRFDPKGGWLAAAPGTAERAAKAVVGILRNEATDAAHYQHLKRLCDARTQRAMIVMARDELGMTRRLSDFDSDPMLLGVLNGVLNLRTGRLLPVSPDLLVSKRCNVAFDPDALCPRFERFMKEVQPDPEVREFLQRFVGYCLTGEVSEQVFAIFHGGGKNGKSVFIELLGWLLGDYAKKIQTELLMHHQRNPQGASPDIVALKGLRLAFANETEEGRRLAEARVKDLTGGDMLTGRRLYSDDISFRPSHKLVIVGNHKPEIADMSVGMWRRVALTPWRQIIAERDRDPHLLEKLKREGAGILNWAMDGLREWQERGLQIPQAVKDATSGYRDDEDIIGEWLGERCEVGRGLYESKSGLYADYQQWAEDNGHKPLAQGRLVKRLTSRGFSVDGGKRNIEGLALSDSSNRERRRRRY